MDPDAVLSDFPEKNKLTAVLEKNYVLGASLLSQCLAILSVSKMLSSHLHLWFEANQAAMLGIGIAGILLGVSLSAYAVNSLREKPQNERKVWDYIKSIGICLISVTLIVSSALMSGSPAQMAFMIIGSMIKLGLAIGEFYKACKVLVNPMATEAERLNAKDMMVKHALEILTTGIVIALAISVLSFPPASMVLAVLFITFIVMSATWSLMGKYTPNLKNNIKDLFGVKNEDLKSNNQCDMAILLSEPPKIFKMKVPISQITHYSMKTRSLIHQYFSELHNKIKEILAGNKDENKKDLESEKKPAKTLHSTEQANKISELTIKIQLPVQNSSAMIMLGLLGDSCKVCQPICTEKEQILLSKNMPPTEYEKPKASINIENEALSMSHFEEEELGEKIGMRF